MKFMIVNAFGRSNRGDSVLLDECIHEIRAKFPDAEIAGAVFEGIEAARALGDAFSHVAAGAAGGLAASMRSSASRAGSATSCGTVMRLRTSPSTSPSSTHAR